VATHPGLSPDDVAAYLAQFPREVLDTPRGRRALTRTSPMLFALLYADHHLRSEETGGQISFSEAHIEWFTLARRYMRPVASVPAMSMRDAIIAPRGLAKSTDWFLLVPLWLAAHGWRGFQAAFADSATQAEEHLSTFKRELETNQLLRLDYPDLCTPARRPKGGALRDTQSMYVAKSGFIFAARGIDSAVLGLKVGNKRPDHIILDDIEGSEGSYSPRQKESRLKTVTSGILPMNPNASVTMAGTVAMPGSIIDDIAAKQRGDEYPSWVDDEKFIPRYYDIIQTNDDGTERSIWPERYPMSWIQEYRHTRSFQSQYRNRPLAADSAYWTSDVFRYRPDEKAGLLPIQITHQILSIDPAVTDKEKSDYTGLAVVAYSRIEDVCLIRDAWQVKLPPGEPLRLRVVQILNQYPEISGVVVETNQGGDLWRNTVLTGLPVPVRTTHSSDPKEVRAGRVLSKYQRRKVFHEKRLPALEGQMVAFPRGAYDDLVDAACQGVTVFLKGDTLPPRTSAREGAA
jgi:phage terminase large subunit-like protein